MNEMGKAIVELEGRFDKAGGLLVYMLPSGDGGGAYEVAGINERHHPSMAAKLKRLIEQGQQAQALEEAAIYIEEYTKGVKKFLPEGVLRLQHIEFILRDTAFNRGLKGAATVLQIAVEVPVDGVVGPQTKEAFTHFLHKHGSKDVARRITQARETYERNSYPWKTSKRNESSKFWAGLTNRWTKSHQIALTRFA